MSANGAEHKREGVSLATLVIAALASGAAAIVTSHFWHGGTIMTAAITPVIVALVKEGIQRPMQSEVVRRPVQRLAETRTRTRAPARAYERVGAPDRPHREPPPPSRHAPQQHTGRPAEPAQPAMTPVQTYGGRRRRWHLRAAIVTGVIAFAIAAIVLTVPELVFGGSVAGHGGTTFFSSGKASHTSSSNSQNQNNNNSNGNSGKSQTNTTQTTPSQQPQGTQTSTTPQQQSPPSQAAPPSGGTTSPQPAPSTPPAP